VFREAEKAEHREGVMPKLDASQVEYKIRAKMIDLYQKEVQIGFPEFCFHGMEKIRRSENPGVLRAGYALRSTRPYPSETFHNPCKIKMNQAQCKSRL